MAPSCTQLTCSSVPALSTRGEISRRTAAPRRLCLRTRAAGDSGDLDEAWRSFKKSAGIKMPVTERVATEAPRFSSGASSRNNAGGWNRGPSADQLRRQESQLLNAWTQERLMQLAGGGTMVLVLLLLFAAGGPPSDARCTLPWC